MVRTRDLTVSGLNWRRSHFKSIRGDGKAGYSPRPSRLASVVVPDLTLVAWFPFALAAALRVTGSQRFDCMITTSPPESAHLVGLAVKRIRGIPWVADLQDGWTFEATRPAWPLAVQRRLDRALEAAMAKDADLVTTVTDPLTEDMRTRLGTRAETVTNGFDPDERVQSSKEAVGLDPDRFSLVYTGRLAFARSSPRPLLDAVRALRADRPDLAARLEVVFAGPLTDDEREEIDAPDLEGATRTVGNLDRREALALQSAADALLLVVPPARPRTVATAKLYEYLLAARPILVLGEGSAAAATVEATGSGLVSAAEDPERIAAAIADLMEDRVSISNGSARTPVAAFGYPAIAERLATEIDALIAS